MEELINIFESSVKNYNKTKNATFLIEELQKICVLYRDYFGVGDLLLSFGESLIEKGDADAGIAVIRLVERSFKAVANETLLCLRLADIEFKEGNEERGKAYLLRLVQATDNYEEAIEINSLSDVWNAHKSRLGDLPPSLRTKEARALAPEECSHSISEILSLPGDAMLSAISEHLGELCADGEQTDRLTAEEQTVFFIDEWITSVNGDGIFHYLNYRGHHLKMLVASARALNSIELQKLCSMVENKFPRNKIPQNLEEIEVCLEKMENAGIDFEDAEQFYHDHVENELLDMLARYIKQNAHSFQ